MIRCLIGVLLLASTSAAVADPILLLLLRMARDKTLSASVEAGVDTWRQSSTIPSPVYGFALPAPPIPQGSEDEQMRALIDQNFLHLTSGQRDELFAALRKKLQDPQNAQEKPRLMAAFALTAREMREGYRGLDALTYAEKKSLAAKAREEYRRMSEDDRRQLLDTLRSGTLPVPRDLSDIMLAEFNSVAPVTFNGR